MPEDVELHGVTIPAGSIVNVRFGAGNRDPRRYECPGQLDLERGSGRTHLAFGVGLHHCLGATLARQEMYFAFKALVEKEEEAQSVLVPPCGRGPKERAG